MNLVSYIIILYYFGVFILNNPYVPHNVNFIQNAAKMMNKKFVSFDYVYLEA